jgi:hypothetical protein
MADIADNFITDFNKLSATNKSVITANASSQGITPQEYLKQRGGVEATMNKYGDSYNPARDLTAAEYSKVMADARAKGLTGVSVGQAINEATAAKQGISLWEFTGGLQGTKPAGYVGPIGKDGSSVSNVSTGPSTAQITNRAAVTTALEDFRANLQLAGLGSLADVIDGYIKQDLSASQIKINLVGTDEYKARFPGMAALSKAGRAINEATYISMEKGMTSILKAYGLDDKIFGTTEKLGTVIANQVSVAEYEQRVAIASDKVKKNTDVLASLNEYYGVDITGAISYLLDPKLGMDIVKKQIRAAEIGAAAEMYKFDLDKAAAESYINVSGTSDLNSLKESFGKARLLANIQSGLASIESDKGYNELQAVASTLGGDQQQMLESQRRALREQARFAGQSGISSASLKTQSNI